ncbi:MAG TPA: DNA polymerase I [Candidatus Magasanikbacteria bacterium]|nr:MAG: DNA polymerase I [Candidatus Magasanikbacteria bacterium RIFOXYC2_FULL_39_8]HAT04017.1 DNA polymerase I [Candidatus Magasanikbacteria bacterium]
MNKKTFVIIDGNAIVHRAYHALPPLTAKDGTMVNAVYGFTSMLLKVLTDLKPDYMAVSFDVAGGTFRDTLYTAYKATRVKADQELYDQIPLCHQVVEAFGIPIFEKKGFEADDVIGTVTEKIKRLKDYKITSVVVSGDMDLLQLVDDDKTEVYLLRKGMSDFHLYNEKAVEERFGFGPKYIVDYKALRGDTSDNIPGVKGIGEKTALELITEIGGVEAIYEEIKTLSAGRQGSKDQKIKAGILKKLEEGESDAKMSKELATIKRDVPDLDFKLENCAIGEFDREKLTGLFQKFEFYSLVKRLPGTSSEQIDKSTHKQATRKEKFSKIIVCSDKNIKEVLKDLERSDIFACKEMLNGKDVLNGELIGLVFVTGEHSYYISKEYLKDIQKIFEDNNKIIVGHDIKQLVKVLQHVNAEAPQCHLFDIMVASYLLNSSTRAHDLGSIALRELGRELPAGSDQGSLFGVNPQVVADELQMVLDIYDIYKQKLERIEDLGLFQDVEMGLIPVLAEMELNGVAIDTHVLGELSVEVNAEIKKLEKKIWKETGEEFNVASSVQLRDILFEKMGLPKEGIKKGKTGYSTASSELEKLREYHPVIEYIEDYRELEKLRNTYIDVLPELVNKKTGRIHTSFNQAVTTTGRLSSSDPNLQNIPIRTDLGRRVREAFVAEPGNMLIVADYSQIELRIVASLANDKQLINIFERGEDVHAATAAVINGVSLEQVTKEMRSAAKGVNFGVLYGMGAFGLSSRTGITQWEAKDFIKKYFESFKDVKKYLDATLEFAHKEGYVETLFGRRRYIPELMSPNYQLKLAGERMAINMPVQGTAADLMKMAMIKINAECRMQNAEFRKNVRIILQVHDELVFEVKKKWAEDIAKIVKEEMEHVAQLRVPVEVHVGIGTSWGKIK